MSALDDLRSVEKELKAEQSPALADIRKINAESKIADSLAVDADRAARVQAAERDFGVPRDIATKHLDLLEQKRRPDLTGIFDESPVTARHLQNPDYAALVSDELDKQRALERSTRGYWENIGRGVLGRTATLTGNLLEFGGRVLNREGIDAATPFLGVGGGQNPIGDFLTKTGQAISEGSKVYDYVPMYDWERVKTDFGADSLAGFIVEQGIVSLPDMAATVALPAYIASRTEEIGEDRAKNKGLAEPTIEDLVQAAAPAVLVSLLEKVGAKAVFDLAAVETFKQAGKAALSAGKREAATEFAQEIIEYGGTTLGTDVEFDPYEALDRGLAGAVAGGGFGSAVRGATANYQAALNQYGRSMIEQDVIDKFNDVADGKLRDRSIEKLKAYAEDVGASYGIDTIRVDGDVFNQDGLKLQGLKAPAESGDVEMSVGDYVSLPKETRAEIRPFVRIQPDSMSQIEAQSWEEGQQAQLDRMIKSAKVKAENYEKANALSKGLAEQLIATGRYNKTQALMMSKIHALYLTVKAEREGITVEEAHAMLPLTIERIDGQQGANIFEQMEAEENRQAVAKGLDMSYEARMKRAKEMGYTTSAFSGSTHDIRKMDASTSNPENDFGRGIYASTSIDDVNANYAGVGPDLTARIERESERVADELMDNADEMLEEYGISMERYEADEAGVAEEIARERLKGPSDGIVYPLLIKADKYAVIGGDKSTKLQGKNYYALAEEQYNPEDYPEDMDRDDAISEIRDELESNDEEGLYVQVYDALRNTDLYQDEGAIASIIDDISDYMADGELDLDYLDDAIRRRVTAAFDDNTGDLLSAGEISAQVLKNLGYEGVIDNRVDLKFGAGRKYGTGMAGVDQNTQHIITFPGFESNIRSINAAFDPDYKASSDLLAQPAYHGSPYRFDKFSTDKIGTGEGAQAYGYGLYFAGRKEVAEYYRGALAGKTIKLLDADGQVIDEDKLPINAELFAITILKNNGGDYGKAADDIRKWSIGDNVAEQLAALDSLRKQGITVRKDTGQLYEVEIPDDGDYLLWDKPLSEQPENVKNALSSYAEKIANSRDARRRELNAASPGRITHPVVGKYANKEVAADDIKAGDVYEAIASELGSPAKASKLLRNSGIPGIKYLDGTSRSDGEGSYNYVIFSDEDVQITKTFYQGEVPTRDEGTDQNDDIVENDVQFKDDQKVIPESVDDVVGIDAAMKLATSQPWAKGRDLKSALQKRALDAAQSAGVDISSPSPQSMEYLSRVLVKDALVALDKDASAVGWYDIKTRRALGIVGLIHPEILTDEESRFAFTWALAVTSNGIKVDKNFELAEEAYSRYKRDGKMPTDINAGQAQKAINQSLGLFNELVERWGIGPLRQFMQTNFTVGEINALDKALSPGGEHVDVTVKGASILGPKIGNGFFSNLYGDFSALTMDRWLIRTWGRFTGTLIKEQPVHVEKATARLQDAINAVKGDNYLVATLSDSFGVANILEMDMADLAEAIQKSSMDKDMRAIMNETPAGMEMRKAGNSLAKYLDGQKEAPAGPNERKFIRSAFNRALTELQTTHGYAKLTMSDLQAVLWFAEKRLYETSKVKEEREVTYDPDMDEVPDYETAARKLAVSKGLSARKIANAVKRVDDGQSIRAQSQDGAANQAGGEQAGVGSFTAKEKRDFRAGVAIRTARANRLGAQKLSWSYSRKGGKNGGGVRLLKKLGVTSIAEWAPGSSLKREYAKNDLPAPVIHELAQTPENGAKFESLISSAKARLQFGAAVHVYPASEYAKMRLFVTEDGTSGFAIKPDGDIISVFSGKGNGHALMDLSIEAGGVKLDCFDTMLPRFYAPHGFRAVSRVTWDDKEAPAGWDKAGFAEYNNGEPDVVMMVYDPAYTGSYEKTDGSRVTYNGALRIQNREIARVKRGETLAEKAAPTGQTFYQSLPNTIEVDGVQRPTKRSDGSPIHPTEEGVRNFWGWFGDSQVVDDQGRPLVVYHGAPDARFVNEDGQFKSLKHRLNMTEDPSGDFWFARSRRVASTYADVRRAFDYQAADPGVVDAYLSLQNPLVINAGGALWRDAQRRGKTSDVIEEAKAGGHDGVIIRNVRDDYGSIEKPRRNEATDTYVVFDPSQIKSATGNTGAFDPKDPSILAQDNTRAHIQFSEVGAVIRLGKTSDLSSFFHEAGHYFLAMEQKFAAHPNATERQKKDFQAILDYIGAPDGNIQREHHEKFARAFERYIGEGRAPSVELKSYFRRFAQWMMQVYTTLKNLDVELTPEIRDVFDRMLATDDQIARASQKFWYEIVLTDKEAEVKSKQKERQEQAKQNALNSKDRGTERLRSRLIKELKARGEAEQRAERKALIDQNKADLSESQRYKAIAWLKDNQVSRDDALEVIGATSPKIPKVLAWVKENNLTEADIRQLQSTGSADLKKQKLVEWMKENEVTPQEVVQALDPKVQAKRRKLNGITSKDGIPLDDAAELLGYPSGHAMITDIAEGPTLSEEASRLADEQMKAKHGDILTDGSIEKMADEIMHSEEQAKALLAQLKALRPSSRLDNEAIKQEAKEIIGRLPAAKIKPDTYYRAEVKHAREYEKALAAGDVAMAAYHAQQRLVQFHLAREATFVKARVDRQRKALKGWQERKYADTAVDPRYAQNLRTYATLWDFRKSSKDEEAEAFSRLERVAAWLAAQANDENRFLQPQILDSILSRVQQGLLEGRPISIPSYETMTVDELQGVYDMASHLRWMGGQMSKEAALARKAEAEEVAASVEENSDREYIEPDIENLPKADIFSFARRFAADHIYLRRKLEQMDGNKDGVLKRLVWDPIVRASNRKYAMRMESADALKEILSPIEDKTLGRGKGKFTVTKGDGTSWTLGTRERIMLALYWGNQYSRDAIMEGHGVTEDEVMQMLSSLKDVELDAVEKLWKFNDRYWPEFSAVNTRMFGATPPKVEPLPYLVNGRAMSGGYMSISYRPSAKDAKRGKDIYEDHASKMLNGNRSMAMSQSGAAIERTGSGGRMVSLEMQNIATAAEEAIHTIAFSETSRAIGRLMTNEVVASAIRKHHSPEGYQSLVDNLTSIMVGDRPPTSKFMQFMRWTRQNLTLAILGYSVRNFVQQPTGYFNVVGKVGEVAAFKGLLEFYSSPFAHMENIKARSVFMRNRVRMVNREVAEIMGEIGTGKEGVFRKYALAHQIVGDSTIVYAAWLAGYKQGLAKHGDEQKAIAYADDIVASTVGSGMSKDMSPMLQGSGFLGSGGAGSEISKQFTFMGGFFSLTINLLEESYKKNKPMKSAKGAANFGRQAFWYLVPPAIVGKILVSSIPGDDDDEAWWQWALSSVAEYGLGSIFFIRDIVSMYKGFNPSIPYQSSFVQFGKGLQELAELFEEDDEIEWSDVKNVVSAAAVVRPMPGVGQVTRTGGYIDSYLKGDEESYVEIYDALVEGEERD